MNNEPPEFGPYKIEKVMTVHDYLQIYISDGSILNIFNRYLIVNITDEQDMVGRIITGAKSNKNDIVITFIPEGSIKVSMRPEDYRGPEAMQYTNSVGRCVVWR